VTGGRWRDGFVEPTELRGTKIWDFRLYGAKKTRPKRRTCARYQVVSRPPVGHDRGVDRQSCDAAGRRGWFALVKE
jgi:hypothetical protein